MGAADAGKGLIVKLTVKHWQCLQSRDVWEDERLEVVPVMAQHDQNIP